MKKIINDNEYNELKKFIGLICRIDVENISIPIYGKVLQLHPLFLEIEARSGDIRQISRVRIIGIEPTYTGNRDEALL